MSGISRQGYGQRDDAYGQTWVRTTRTVELWADLDGIQNCANAAQDINAMLRDNVDLDVYMQANGWALVPAGSEDWEVADAIDQGIAVLEDIAADEARAAAEQ